MELASNLIWAVATLLFLGTILFQSRRGSFAIPTGSVILLAMLVCILMLPVVSISDDIQASQQAALPLPAQTWRLASEGISLGLEIFPLLAALLLLLVSRAAKTQRLPASLWQIRPQAIWLTRLLRLRPPPVSAL